MVGPVAGDAAGNLYFETYGQQDGTIGYGLWKWSAATEKVTNLTFDIEATGPVSVDGTGNVYSTDPGYYNGSNIVPSYKKWIATTQAVETLVSPPPNESAFSPGPMAADGSGDNVYTSSYSGFEKLTHALIVPDSFVEPLTSGSGELPPVLPLNTSLDAVNDQPWLKITGQQNGIVKFSFTSTTMQRTAHITLLGQTIPVMQTNDKVPTAAFYRVLWGSESYTLTGSTRNRLPWEISGIQVVFSEPIVTGDVASLSGVTASALSGLGSNTLTWTIDPVSVGVFTLTLAESGPHALEDAAGNTLAGNSSQGMKVLWGDFDDDGVVNAADLNGVNSVRIRGYGDLFADLNGDGVVNEADVEIVRNQIGRTLP